MDSSDRVRPASPTFPYYLSKSRDRITEVGPREAVNVLLARQRTERDAMSAALADWGGEEAGAAAQLLVNAFPFAPIPSEGEKKLSPVVMRRLSVLEAALANAHGAIAPPGAFLRLEERIAALEKKS